MFKIKEIKPVNIITLLIIIWLLILLAIWRLDNKNQLIDNNDNVLIDDRKAYDDALKRIELLSTRKNNNTRFGVKSEYCKE